MTSHNLAPAHSAGGLASAEKVHVDSDNAELFMDGDIRIADFLCLADARAFANAYNAIHGGGHSRIVAVKDAEIERLRELADTLGMANNQLHDHGTKLYALAQAAERRAEALAGLLSELLAEYRMAANYTGEGCRGEDAELVARIEALTGQATPEGSS